MEILSCGVFYSSTPANEGMVLVCKYGNWYPMHVSSNLKAAEIACTSIGYLSVECELC